MRGLGSWAMGLGISLNAEGGGPGGGQHLRTCRVPKFP